MRQGIGCVLILQGTTGQPKGVTLTHHNLVNNALLVGENMNFQEVREEVVFFLNGRDSKTLGGMLINQI